MLRFFVICTVFALAQGLTPSSFLTSFDKARIKGLFESNLNDPGTVSYAILGLKLLGETVPNGAELCKVLQANIDKPEASGDAIFTASSAAKALGSCTLKANAEVSKVLKLESSVQELYQGTLSQLNLGQKICQSCVVKSLTDALKKDDGIASLGMAFNLAANLDKKEGAAIFERIEDAVVQADEINGKNLQFEGGLSVSSSVISGAYALAKTVGKAPPVSKLQSVKFANYFLSRKNVQQVKGAWSLLTALQTLSSNDFHIPVAITLASQPSVSDGSPKVKVQITNVMGGDLGAMDVQVDSAMRQSDGAVVMSKSKMKAAESATFYEIDLMAVKPGKGFYELTMTSTPVKENKKLAGNEGAVLLVKVLGTIALENVEIGVADADQSTGPKMTSVSHPDKVKKELEADHHHKVIIKFAVKDKASGEKVKVHQAFIRLALNDAEIIYVAEPDASNNYKFDLDVSSKAKEFGSKSGKYSVSLIVGDAVVSNPVNWNLADISLKFPDAPAISVPLNKPKPEIRHLFREPEKRPPQVVSTAFTGLCLVPIGILLVAWMKLGVNVSSFPISAVSIGFHLGLASIFGLYLQFWLHLDMFTTIKYLIMVGVVTFLCGNSMLVKIAEKRKNAA
jgi:oligosaccharyltransferase complex subunit delta (ribophorin II)